MKRESSSKQAPKGVLVKRNKGELVAVGDRTSDLYAPTVMLKGHDGPVTSLAFAPGGNALASSSFDKSIFLWSVFGECVNYGMLKGHKSAVTCVRWSSDGGRLVSSGADHSVRSHDSETMQQEHAFRHHSGVVNDCSSPSEEPDLVASVGDDGLAAVVDCREGTNEAAVVLVTGKVPLTTVAFGFNHLVYVSGLDNAIRAYDARMNRNEPVVELAGHRDTVTGLSLSREGSYMLSNSRDNTLRIWDAKPMSTRANRCLKIFEGATHNFENHALRCSWSADGSKVAGGSADNLVCVWDTTTRKLIYRLPGHQGPVNDVIFHPSQPIIASCGFDQRIFLGEL